MHSVKATVAALAAATMAASAAQAAGVLDQNSPPGGGRFNEGLHWQQQVTAGMSGLLTGITLYGDGTQVNVGVTPGAAFQQGPFVFTGLETLSDAGTFIDTSAAGIVLTAGEPFVIDMQNGADGNILMSLNTYPGGDAWLSFGNFWFDYTVGTGQTFAFQTFMSPTGTPEPGTWALMLMGLGGLGATLRLRRTAAAAV